MNRFKALYFMLLVMFLAQGCAPKESESYHADRGYSGSISISGAFALYPLAVLWSEDFKKIHPHVRFNISAGGAGKGIADVLTDMVDIGLVSRDLHPQETERGAFPIIVAKDAVIATINSQHPNMELLKKRGLTIKELENIFIHGSYKHWKDIDSRMVDEPILVYSRSDAAGAAETWAKFFKSSQEDLKGIGIFGDPGLAQVVKENKLAVGFNNINYVFDLHTKNTSANISALPIDINANGRIDEQEDFYGHLDSLTKAIGNGSYPSPPARDLMFVLQKGKHSKLLKEFFGFILQAKEQGYLLAHGYVPLDSATLGRQLEILNEL
ncbi:PstS family phosphate ABC transporter substrate-binding protein [Sphingobacterium sp. 1.A.4]|uniref:PstS family phosphate ABC transporter substrate-binding protein n=1 Tax=Sphingobacterium sp. 1.A.4 TaxID=2044603 RepID=UPI000C0C063C|nr:PstS family phosphate ABC transporter substrate-binding protein [Sphingobacterium sp. 1.A.4]